MSDKIVIECGGLHPSWSIPDVPVVEMRGRIQVGAISAAVDSPSDLAQVVLQIRALVQALPEETTIAAINRMLAEARVREDAFLTANADLIAVGEVMARHAATDIRRAEQQVRAAIVSDLSALLHEHRFDKADAFDAVLLYVYALAHPESGDLADGSE